MRVKWNTKWREASCVHVALSVKVVVTTTSFPPLVPRVYTFLFVSSTPRALTVLLPSPRLPDPTRHALYVRSWFPLYFHVFVCGVSSPAARWPMFERERKRERGRGRESSEKRAVTEEEGRRKGEREILKRHKGRPHALKGNNSFRDRDRFYSWSDVWEIRLPVGHATHPLFFPYSPPFPSLFLSFFLLSFSFWLLSFVRITRARFIHTTVGRRV